MRIAVGRDGLQFKGKVKVGDKQEWPRWIPTKEMQQREPKKYGQYKDGMPGGGRESARRARHLPLPGQEGHASAHPWHHRPQTIGTNSSNGCFRMINEHVMDLYSRVRVGTRSSCSKRRIDAIAGRAGFAPAFLLACRH